MIAVSAKALALAALFLAVPAAEATAQGLQDALDASKGDFESSFDQASRDMDARKASRAKARSNSREALRSVRISRVLSGGDAGTVFSGRCGRNAAKIAEYAVGLTNGDVATLVVECSGGPPCWNIALYVTAGGTVPATNCGNFEGGAWMSGGASSGWGRFSPRMVADFILRDGG